MSKKNHKLGVIVPYRDRYDHLVKFKRSIINYLDLNEYNYVLIIVEQDDAKLFNRGKLLNIGFERAVSEGCDYVVFHDVDMVPIKVDYGYSDKPTHLAKILLTGGSDIKREIFDTYFGGVTLFPTDQFQKINGYSNDYWGWGFEDDDLFERCKRRQLPVDTQYMYTAGGSNVSLRFNGVNAYCKTKFKGNLSDKTTIVVNIDLDTITCDVNKDYDRYTILSIPSINLSISYDSFLRYKFLHKDKNDNWIYIDSNIKPVHKTTIAVTIDSKRKKVELYQGGTLIGTTKLKNPIPKSFNSDLYIGSTDGKKDLFKGDISYVAIYNDILKKEEIKDISENFTYSLTMPFHEYKSDGNLIQYHDMKMIRSYKVLDLINPDNEVIIKECEIVESEMVKHTPITVPYRKEGYFELLNHEVSGYKDGAWSDINIRYNQLRFHNEMVPCYRDSLTDGLTTCEYKVWDDTKMNKQIHMTVSI